MQDVEGIQRELKAEGTVYRAEKTDGFAAFHGKKAGRLVAVELTDFSVFYSQDSIADAVADLGRPDEIGRVFAGFQKYLYQQQAAA